MKKLLHKNLKNWSKKSDLNTNIIRFCYKKNLISFTRKIQLNKIYNQCFITGYSKNVSSHFHISKKILKKFISSGHVAGVFKRSW